MGEGVGAAGDVKNLEKLPTSFMDGPIAATTIMPILVHVLFEELLLNILLYFEYSDKRVSPDSKIMIQLL